MPLSAPKSQPRVMLRKYARPKKKPQEKREDRQTPRSSRTAAAGITVQRLPLLPDVPVEEVAGIGARRGAALRESGIDTVGDLLLCLPRRYLDRSLVASVADAPLGRDVTLICSVRSVSASAGGRWGRGGGRGGTPTTVAMQDDSGVLDCIWFQGGQYLGLQVGDTLAISGKIDSYRGRRQMAHPEYEFLLEEGGTAPLHTSAIVPLYGSTAQMKERGLQSRGFRRVIRAALDGFADRVAEDLDSGIRRRLGLMELQLCLRSVHFPATLDEADQARRRLAFDELFKLQMELARQRQERLSLERGVVHPRSQRLVPALLASLPFEFTKSQKRVLDEISVDMGQRYTMRRLVHGDVGSGKTIVAVCAMLAAVESGHLSAMMAPTEILADQHFRNLDRLLAPLGIRTVLLLGGQSQAHRAELLTAIHNGSAHIAVGTHALIQRGVDLPNLGLVVIDEQHRFGVQQRLQLQAKGPEADLLVMTATPIPRSLALTMYGDLEVSVLDEVPAGRRPVRTELRTPERRERIFAFVAQRLSEGEQAYVIYPSIEESENDDTRSAVAAFDELSSGALSSFEVGLLHGRMTAEEKVDTMGRYARGEIRALVATTVVEVGLDVPNATVMVVEHAERFGLAQLHQLRGRVGRGGSQSYCILIAYSGERGEEGGGAVEERLRVLGETDDGFAIARRDLELRGQGEVLGHRQAGQPYFAVADLLRDEDLLVAARAEATRLVRVEGATVHGEGERQ